MPLVERETFAGCWPLIRRNEERERLSFEENRARQWASLKALLRHAYETTDFYRQRFDKSGIHPGDINSLPDLEAIPPLTRDDLRSRLPELCSRSFRSTQLAHSATGGTTDTPVRFLRDRACLAKKMAAQARFNAWAGMLPGDKVFYLWGARSDYAENPSWRWRLYDRYLMRRIWAPTSSLNPATLESYRETLNRFRPDIIYAYPTPLALFAEYLAQCGRPVYAPRAVIVTAETLLQAQRTVIEQALRCRVFEHYGSREFGMIAGECEAHNGLHLNPGSAFVELVPLPGHAGLCEVIVTDLLNYGMPLIRYRSNDCALPRNEQCACGRGYPLLGRISGRVADTFVLPNGDLVPGVALTNRVLQVCPGLRKTQIVQEEIDRFRLRFVPGEGFTNSDLKILREGLARFVTVPVRWEFESVTEIERERSGKTRFCISRVPLDRAMLARSGS